MQTKRRKQQKEKIAAQLMHLAAGWRKSHGIMRGYRGEVAEWLMAADCKSAGLHLRWFESSPLHHLSCRNAQQEGAGVVQW